MAAAATTRWLDPDEMRAWRAFLRVHRDLDAALHRRLQQRSGLSAADYEVLVNLSEAEDQRMRAFALAEATRWEKSRLSHHLTRMERRGLVERSECPTDGRGAFVALTADGRAAIEAAAPRHVEDVRRLFLDLVTPEELAAMTAAAERVSAALAADGDGRGDSDGE